MAIRRRLGVTEAREIEFDERAMWLRLRRGDDLLVCNFGGGPVELACAGASIELATDETIHLSGGYITLPPMSGALIR
jgi:maltooligosyltrehalose trehalohydrolase